MNTFKLQLFSDQAGDTKFIRFVFPTVAACNNFFGMISDTIKEHLVSADDVSFSLDCSHIPADELIEAMNQIRMNG